MNDKAARGRMSGLRCVARGGIGAPDPGLLRLDLCGGAGLAHAQRAPLVGPDKGAQIRVGVLRLAAQHRAIHRQGPKRHR